MKSGLLNRRQFHYFDEIDGDSGFLEISVAYVVKADFRKNPGASTGCGWITLH